MTPVPGLDSIQLFDPLDDATEAALRASIERFGVMMPVAKDQHGRILDGHHRDRLARELGVPYDEKVFVVRDENHAREVARSLNEDRRQLRVEQRRPVVAALREQGHSLRAIGQALKVSHVTVKKDLAAAETEGGNPLTPAVIGGTDGKSYPARRVSLTPARPGTYHRPDKTAPFAIKDKKSQQTAAAHSRRMVDALSQIDGICRGLREVDAGMVASALTTLEARTWATKAGELARALRDTRTQLLEASDARQAQ